MRVRANLQLAVSIDANEKKCSFARTDDTLSQTIRTMDVESSGVALLAASETNYTLPMGKVVSGLMLYIESNRQFSVRFDGEVTGHTVGQAGNSLLKRIYLDLAFSAAPIVSNLEAEEAEIAFVIAGNKA